MIGIKSRRPRRLLFRFSHPPTLPEKTGSMRHGFIEFYGVIFYGTISFCIVFERTFVFPVLAYSATPGLRT